MKRKNILKFISLLGVGSFVSLSAASCKQPVTEKPAKPTNGSGNSSNATNGGSDNTNSSTGGGNTTNPPAGSESNNTSNTTGNNGSAGSGTMVTTPNPEEEKMKLKSFLDTIKEENFEVLKNNDKTLRSSINLDELKKEDLKLQDTVKEENPVKSGWTLGVELVSDSKNKNVGSIDINIKYTKNDNSMSTDPVKLTLTGFKSLKTDLSSILFKTQSVGVSLENANTKENKTVLDLGSAGFSTLVDLNTKSMASSSLSSSESDSGNERQTRSVSLSLRDDPQPAVSEAGNTDNQTAPAMMDKSFSGRLTSLINSSSNSSIKTELQKLETAYTGFKVADLYIDGTAKLNSLYKKSDSAWQGSYYLTSKDDSSKLTLKVKSLQNWSLEIPGIVVEDLLPDDVKISVSKIESTPEVDVSNQSNLEAYKTEAGKNQNQNEGYFIKNDMVFAKFNRNSETKNIAINSISLPSIGANKLDKILFKAEYIFDGVGVYNGSVFGTKLVFKKILKDNPETNNVLKFNILNEDGANGNGAAWIPNRKGDDMQARIWNVGQVSAALIGVRFISKKDDSTGFDESIYGDKNSKIGDGVSQLIEKDNYISTISGRRWELAKLESATSTTMLLFSR
ncbi:hypothetical protein, partial [Mycoplasma bradburyae]|uniref:hypothetical protein n=1 Tax=Mycoplasma bradburyae TaxID=2963128 RepID=UPI0023415F76